MGELLPVAGITMISGLCGLVLKETPYDNNKWIPLLCGTVGGILGGIAYFTGMEGFPMTDFISSVAIGVGSGLASTGAHQAMKQLESHGAREL